LAITQQSLPPEKEWPVFWFAVLEKAVRNGNHRKAARAQRHLARLGVRVNYGIPAPKKGGSDHVIS
jgi:hypothetical protein